MSNYRDRDTARKILNNSRVIAVVGLSDKKERASHRVASYLQNQGYKIIPVNPGITEVLGARAYPDLKSVPEDVDLVDVFRRSEYVPPVVRSAVGKGVKAVWLQEGIVNEEAGRIADEAGIDIIMDLCMRKMHEKFGSLA